MKQKILIYLGKISIEHINRTLLDELKKYYMIDIVDNNTLLNFNNYNITIIHDHHTFFLENTISNKNNKMYIWWNKNFKNSALLENSSYKINAIISNELITDNFTIIKHSNCNINKLLDIFDFYRNTTKLKILCNWTDQKDINNVFKRLCHTSNTWNNIEIVDENNADYYCILNYPQEGDFYEPSKTILITMEDLKNEQLVYPKKWLKPKHRDYMFYFDKHNGIEWHLDKTYNQLMTESIEKTKILSSITSSEYHYTGHIKRINFLKYIDDHIKYDLYGRTNKFNFKNYKMGLPYLKKDDGILPYKYTISCENNLTDGYFTEKIVDAILGECLCFYWGCPNLEKFIDSRAYIRIDINNHEKALKTIIDSINNNEWDKRINIIRREKYKILNELQLMPTIEKIILDEQINQDYFNNNLTEHYETVEKYISFHNDKYLLNVIDTLCGMSKYFIESGTYRAGSSRYVAENNNNITVYTCDNNLKSYSISKKNTSDLQNIHIYHDTSVNMLNNLTNNIDFEETSIFWLDAHNNNDHPIHDELNIIINKFKKYYILIDDFKNEYCSTFNYNNYYNKYTIDGIKYLLPKMVDIYFPNYTDKTSSRHPLVGWVLITNQLVPINDNIIKYGLDHETEIKVLNLDRRIDRWYNFIEKNKKYNLNFSKYSAIDGLNLKMDDDIKKIFKIPSNFIGKRLQITHEWRIGVLGCALSHISLWKELVSGSCSTYIILEDDAELCDNFDTKITKIFYDLRNDNDWDLLYLGIGENCYNESFGDYLICDNIMKLAKRLRKYGSGTFGYCISKKGATKLLEYIDKNGIQQPIDHFMLDRFDELNIYGVFPHIVSSKIYSSSSDDTDIQNVYQILK